jgi:hypothetical protein
MATVEHKTTTARLRSDVPELKGMPEATPPNGAYFRSGVNALTHASMQ